MDMSQDTRRNAANVHGRYAQQQLLNDQSQMSMEHQLFYGPGMEDYTAIYQGSQPHFTPSESALSYDPSAPVTLSDEYQYMNGVNPTDIWLHNNSQTTDTQPRHQHSATSISAAPGLAMRETSWPSPESINRSTPEAAMHMKMLSQTSGYLGTPVSTPHRPNPEQQYVQPQDSPANYHTDLQPTSAPTQASPLITFSQHTRGDSPARSDHTRQYIHKKRSASNLSQGDYFSDLEEGDGSRLRPPAQAQEEEWEEEQRDGVDPTRRSDQEIPSFGDIEQQEVQDSSLEDTRHWLEITTLETGVERRARTQYRAERLRSRSTGARPDPTEKPILHAEQVPGPGIEIDETSEYWYSTDSESQASLEHDDHPETTRVQLPPQQEITTAEDSAEPLPSQFIFKRSSPWRDAVAVGQTQENTRFQPENSNAAIYKYMKQVREFDSSSRRATWGTGRVRRLSEGDAASVVEPKTRHLSLTKQNFRERKTSIVNILKRSNSKNRQSNAPEHLPMERVQSPQPIDEAQSSNTSFFGHSSPPSKTKTPSITAALAGATGAATAVAVSPTNLNVSMDSHGEGMFRRAFRHVRSRSDAHRSPKNPSGSGIGSMWFHQGGPPVPNLRSPENEYVEQAIHMDEIEPATEITPSPQVSSMVRMSLSPRPANVMPDLKGFKVQITELNPHLNQQLVDRIAHDQVKRYKRLVRNKVEHAAAVADGKCASGQKCPAVGGQPDILPAKVSARDTGSSASHFKVASGGDSDDEDAAFDGVVTSAAFPETIPLPPVKKLPARFECPLCFQIKTFQKPSDWTKHVHEDVQPFTCTFPNCQEQRSFKRKADWVRHENERHRQLEWWECTYAECTHVCYRKDNFVQHLVREHKRREPKSKSRVSGTPKGKGKAASLTTEEREFWDFVESCRHEKSSDPRKELCKFCGNNCTSWKKFSVHVGKHMEQIAMPVLELVNRRNVTKDTIISPVEPMQRNTTHLHQDPGLMADIHSNPLSPYTQSGGSNYPGSSANHSPYPQMQPGFAVNSNFVDSYPGNGHFHQSLSPAQFGPEAHYGGQVTSDYDMSIYSQMSQPPMQGHIPATIPAEMNFATTAVEPSYDDNPQYFSSPEQPYMSYTPVNGMDSMQHLTPPPTSQPYNSQVYPYAPQQQWQ